MNLHNPLPELWDSFLYSADALKVAGRISSSTWTPNNANCQDSVAAYKNRLLIGTDFNRYANLQATFGQVQKEHSDLFVLALWAVFERFLRDYLLEKGQVLEQQVMPNTLGNGIYQHYQKEVEFWKPDEILGFIKNLIIQQSNNIHLIGHAKQIYTYRNWVAHGKKAGRMPSHITPATAYETLTQITDILLQHA